MFSKELLIKAENGDLEAMLDLANSYFKGAGTSIDPERSFYWYSKAFEANSESIAAINGLADCYIEGLGVEADTAKGIELLKKTADKNDAYGLCMIAYSYYEGVGNEKDIDKAIEYFEKASRAGSRDAIQNIHSVYCEKYEKSIANIKYTEFLRLLASEQNPLAMVELFYTYIYEEIAPKDENTAMYYLNKAVALNHPRAITVLACDVYSLGSVSTIAPDDAKSKELIEKAAHLGDDWALNIISRGYCYGNDGFEQDIHKAKEYFELCIEKADIHSKHYSDALCGLGLELCDTRNDFFDSKRGINLLSMAAELNDDCAAHYLGLTYENGTLVEADPREAVYYYTIGAKNGHRNSIYHLGKLLLNGWGGLPKDEITAAKLFEKAVQLGDIDSMEELGLCAYSGNGMPVDKERARILFEQGAKENLVLSQYSFALMNLNGEGGPKNCKAAEYWYNRVLENNSNALDHDAKWDLAVMYSTETKEYSKGFPLWVEFAKEGDAEAQFNLAIHYANGWGVAQDENIAKYWMNLSAQQGKPEAIQAMNEVAQAGGSVVTPAVQNQTDQVYETAADTVPADNSVYIKIIAFSSVFLVIGFLASMIISQQFLISLLVSYLVSVIPLSIMRLKGLKMNGKQAVLTATAGYFAHQNSENGCAFALAFMLGRWLMNYLMSVIVSPYWYIKSIVMLIKSHSK